MVKDPNCMWCRYGDHPSGTGICPIHDGTGMDREILATLIIEADRLASTLQDLIENFRNPMHPSSDPFGLAASAFHVSDDTKADTDNIHEYVQRLRLKTASMKGIVDLLETFLKSGIQKETGTLKRYEEQLATTKAAVAAAQNWLLSSATTTYHQYLLWYKNSDGADMDLIVTAKDPQNAWSLWKEYYQDFSGVEDNNLIQIYVLSPVGTEPMAHEWSTPPTLIDIRTGEIVTQSDVFTKAEVEDLMPNTPNSTSHQPSTMGASITYDDNDPSVVLARIHPASHESVGRVLSANPESPNGRSPWVWLRLPNGDAILGVFPQGDTYLECEEDATFPET